ncbi:hypothetical protein TNCV_1196941 [Trichonephila clavipes]|uniref:Uncharacterized protein n=1 Tax=Trichonephila clavipes TaxID=2585209 RepID=A0A8X6S3G6_TRICX|nr:hypothetical protein TNCV_1196941 [Trichonephila clavipes]
MKSVAKSPRVAEQCDFNIHALYNGEIGQGVGRNEAIVMRICHRSMQEEKRIDDPTHIVVPLHVIASMAVMNRAATSRTIAQQIQPETHDSVSTHTIRRHCNRVECP